MKVINIPISQIEQNENSRVIYKEADLAELMHSMKKNGLLQPVSVRQISANKYDAVYGNRRILAAKKLDWVDIPCNVIKADTENDRDILNMIENIKRKNTTVAEDGRMFVALKDRGLSFEEIAARMDITRERVFFAVDCFKHIPIAFHKDITHSIPNGPKRAPGRISPSSAFHVLGLRKKHGLSKRQTKKLLDFSKREAVTAVHIGLIAPMMGAGFSLSDAMRLVEDQKMVEVRVFVNLKDIEKVEKKTGKTINQNLGEYLESFKGAKVQLAPSNKIGSHRTWKTRKETSAA